jgi:hypothetical protein
MPVTPCPARLQRYIKRLNQESGVEAQELKAFLQAVRNKQDPYIVKRPSTITIDLTNFTVHIRHPLSDALSAIDPPELAERILECPVCHDLYWAGREDKPACDKHVNQWRQREYRKEKKKREGAAAAKRRRDKATETLLAMNTTAQSVIRAIMDKGARDFHEIDGAFMAGVFQRRPRTTE